MGLSRLDELTCFLGHPRFQGLPSIEPRDGVREVDGGQEAAGTLAVAGSDGPVPREPGGQALDQAVVPVEAPIARAGKARSSTAPI